MNETLVEHFKQMNWANDRLLEFCGTLTDEQLERSSPGGYGTVKDTLTHLVAAQGRYVVGITQEPRAPDEIHESKAFAGLERLRQDAMRSGGRLAELATSVTLETVHRTEWGGKRYERHSLVLLLQALDHAKEHRTNVTTVLAAGGIEPPPLDGWAYGEVRGFVRELR